MLLCLHMHAVYFIQQYALNLSWLDIFVEKFNFFFFFNKKIPFFAQIAFAFLKEIDCIQGDLGNVGHLKDNLVTEYLFYYFLQHTYMYEFGYMIYCTYHTVV